jgi:DnaJ-class molecular chaperone
MAKRIQSLSKMPNQSCLACHGLGTISMTAHFYTGDVDWEAQCWECFGNDAKVNFPHPRTADNG